jgi:hypothetical protein
MDDIKEALLGIDQGSRYCNDAEIMSFTEKYKYVLQAFFPSVALLLAVLQKMMSRSCRILSRKQ